jgi:hypothetical protein
MAFLTMWSISMKMDTMKPLALAALMGLLAACGGGGGGSSDDESDETNGGSQTSTDGGATTNTGNTGSGNEPVAAISGTEMGQLGGLVTLNGAQSTDPQGDTLNYTWTFVDRPLDSTVEFLAGNTNSEALFSPDREGLYIVELIVDDGSTQSAPVEFTVAVGQVADNGNTIPLASAGVGQNVMEGDTVTLDGTGSADPDGDSITYAWRLVSSPNNVGVVLDDPTIAQPSFIPPIKGEYIFSLTVNDGELTSAGAQTSVIVEEENVAPIANAGPDQKVLIGQVVNLSAAGSFDQNGDPLNFEWRFVSKPLGSLTIINNFILSDASIIPDMAGQYIIQLIANDFEFDSEPDQITITVFATQEELDASNQPEAEPEP